MPNAKQSWVSGRVRSPHDDVTARVLGSAPSLLVPLPQLHSSGAQSSAHYSFPTLSDRKILQFIWKKWNPLQTLQLCYYSCINSTHNYMLALGYKPIPLECNILQSNLMLKLSTRISGTLHFGNALSHLLPALQGLQYNNMGFNALHLILS